MRDAIAAALEQEKFIVDTAENGVVGLELARSEAPDLILLDLLMPIMDGHEFLTKLRQDPRNVDTKVMVLTAMDDVVNIGTAYEKDIAGYITKSTTSLDELLRQVREEIYRD